MTTTKFLSNDRRLQCTAAQPQVTRAKVTRITRRQVTAGIWMVADVWALRNSFASHICFEKPVWISAVFSSTLTSLDKVILRIVRGATGVQCVLRDLPAYRHFQYPTVTRTPNPQLRSPVLLSFFSHTSLI